MTAARMGKSAVKAAVTDWFCAFVYPVRKGEYECERTEWCGRKSARVTRRLRWGKQGWSYTEAGDGFAVGSTALMCYEDGDKWRGLASDPTKAGA